MTQRDDTCWNCLGHQDTRYVGHDWFICEACSVRWRRQPQLQLQPQPTKSSG